MQCYEMLGANMSKNKTRESTTALARPHNFVEPSYEEQRRDLPAYAPRHEVSHVIDVPMNASQHIEMKTSAVDRGKGFLIVNVPLFGAFALGVLLLAILMTGHPFWSFWSFCVFWLSFVAAWLYSYKMTLDKSAEGVSHYEARQKWGVIREEQRRRWEHYDRQIGDE